MRTCLYVNLALIILGVWSGCKGTTSEGNRDKETVAENNSSTGEEDSRKSQAAETAGSEPTEPASKPVLSTRSENRAEHAAGGAPQPAVEDTATASDTPSPKPPKLQAQRPETVQKPKPTAEQRAKVGRLIEQLNAPEMNDRKEAAKQLAEMGPVAAEAVPFLLERLRDEDPIVQNFSAFALGKIGLSALPVLRECIKDEDPKIRFYGARAMGLFVDHADKVVGILVEHLSDPDNDVRLASAISLGRLGPPAKDAEQALMQAEKNDSDDRVKQMARRALEEIRKPDGRE